MTKNIVILLDDIHLEGREQEQHISFAKKLSLEIESLKNKGLNPIVVFAGDIGEGVSGIEWVSQFKTDIIYVCGNHEFWHNDYYENIDNIRKLIKEKRYDHIHFLHNDVAIINNIRFIGTTLWTNLGEDLPWWEKNYIARYYMAMGDFKRGTAKRWYNEINEKRLIDYLSANGVEKERINDLIENQYFNPLIEIEENKIAQEFIANSLQKNFEGQTIVVSHHLPCREVWMKEKNIKLEDFSGESINIERRFYDGVKGNNPLFKEILMSGFYSNNLINLFYQKNAPDFWFHGHYHTPVSEIIGKTKIISSPVGYKKQSSELTYKVINVARENYEPVKEFLKKEVQNYNWNDNFLMDLRELELVIKNFQMASITGLIVAEDFKPILKKYQEAHISNINKLNHTICEWLKIIYYYKKNKEDGNFTINKNIDFYIVKKELGILDYRAKNIKKESDNRYKIPEPLAAAINKNSFLDIHQYQEMNTKNLKYYHYTEWLKEINQIQMQISIFKQFIIDFIENSNDN